MSDPQNPGLIPPVSGGGNLSPELIPPQSLTTPPVEDPPWGFAEIVGIIVVGAATLVLSAFGVILLGHRFLYPQEPLVEGLQGHPMLLTAAQAFTYLVVIAFMVFLVSTNDRPFSEAIRWKWPEYSWAYLFGGFGLALALQILGRFVPIPKDLPMDRLFETSFNAWVLSVFGVFIAPLMEELFFRGFLYPVLARKLGMIVSIALTAIGFALVHAPQLGRAWGPVLIIFLVGVTLTATRALTKSVAAGWLIHFAYNGTLFGLMFVATSGFRHMEVLNQ